MHLMYVSPPTSPCCLLDSRWKRWHFFAQWYGKPPANAVQIRVVTPRKCGLSLNIIHVNSAMCQIMQICLPPFFPLNTTFPGPATIPIFCATKSHRTRIVFFAKWLDMRPKRAKFDIVLKLANKMVEILVGIVHTREIRNGMAPPSIGHMAYRAIST